MRDAGDVELLACLLGSAGHGAAGALLDGLGDLFALARADEVALSQVPGIGPRRARRVLAAVELGRRVVTAAPREVRSVCDADDAFALLGPALARRAHEELHALYLDRRRRPLGCRVLTRGSDRFTVVDPRQIFRPAVALGAAGVVLAHNHPSGDPTPSAQDREVTRRVAEAGQVLGVELVDHLVVGDMGFVSMRASGDLGTRVGIAAEWTA